MQTMVRKVTVTCLLLYSRPPLRETSRNPQKVFTLTGVRAMRIEVSLFPLLKTDNSCIPLTQELVFEVFMLKGDWHAKMILLIT